MNYKEKIIALLNDKELSQEQKKELEFIFPELKESEDEKIKKELIDRFKSLKPNFSWYEVPIDNILAWLEKQGEQKPTDKVEPKFHKDEWLCENEPNNYARFIQILETVNVQGKERYRISRDIHNDEDIVEFDFVEKYYHKFDIIDAKDGDVLAVNWYEDGDSLEKIIIFKKYHNKGVEGLFNSPCVEGYGNTFKNGKLAFDEQVPYYSKTWTDTLQPATIEQRGLLFSKMKKAGYEWDAEKKELKKIEQKSDSYCQDNCKGFQETGKCFADGECKAKRDAEQKHAWSDEDEYQFNTILHGIDLKREFYKIKGNKEEVERYNTQCNWLKSIKDKVQPKQKQEWSEEDEKILGKCIDAASGYYSPEDKQGMKDWLESIKNRVQPHWKSTDEQMNCFKQAIDLFKMKVNDDSILRNLNSLYDDLKKL